MSIKYITEVENQAEAMLTSYLKGGFSLSSNIFNNNIQKHKTLERKKKKRVRSIFCCQDNEMNCK